MPLALAALCAANVHAASATGTATATVVGPAVAAPTVTELLTHFAPAAELQNPAALLASPTPPVRLPIPTGAGAAAAPSAAAPSAGSTPSGQATGGASGIGAPAQTVPQPTAQAAGGATAMAVLGGSGPAYSVSRSEGGTLQVEYN